MEGPRNARLSILNENQLTRLHNVDGLPAHWKEQIDEAISQLGLFKHAFKIVYSLFLLHFF